MIRSADIVLSPTSLLTDGSKKGSTDLYDLLHKIHFHRIIVDEAHDNGLGIEHKKELAKLSATHRLSVSGKPLGRQLSDLYAKVCFLRVSPFDRPTFWSQRIENPFCAKDVASLRVLRSLLSHILVRHSKEQTHNGGRCLVALPPLNVEHVLLDFGSDEERQLYALIEFGNRTNCAKITATKTDAVSHSKYIQCKKLLLDARRACAHASVVDLSAMQHWPTRVDRANKKAERGEATTAPATAGKMNRKDVFDLAMKRTIDDPIRMEKMRRVVYDFQSGAEKECPICWEVGRR